MSQILFKKSDADPDAPKDSELDEVVVVAELAEHPATPCADGVNGLVRNHWFNGKLLTGKALSRERRYNDLRDRLVAQIHGAGVAWGLSLELPSQRPPLPPPWRPVEDDEDDDQQPNPEEAERLRVELKKVDAQLEHIRAQLDLLRSRLADAREAGNLDEAQELEGQVEVLEAQLLELEARRRELNERLEAAQAAVGGAAAANESSAEGAGFPSNAEEGKGSGIGSVCPDDTLVLHPGLAFDDTGRPILVSQPHPFDLNALLDAHEIRPTIATAPPVRFQPCVCVHEAPFPPGQTGFSTGVYLLVIEPGQCPTGPAKVQGAMCKDAVEPCVPDAVREGFRLRLVYLPAPWEYFHDSESPWAMRSNVAHWYHEVFEQRLHQRWNEPPMPGSCASPGQRQLVANAIPLAALFVQQDRSASFIDPWIPRRPIVGTRSAEALHHALGAPTASASAARLRQFQCQLGEALAIDGARRRNLYDLGFRAIPPAGFLPLHLTTKPGDGVSGALRQMTWGQLTQARKAAQAYFRRTNLIPLVHVAPLDDDLLLELQRAADRDMIPVRPPPEQLEHSLEQLQLNLRVAPVKISEQTSVNAAGLVGRMLLSALFKAFGGATMEQLVNREIAFVRVIVPMEGMRRSYPGIGRVKGARTTMEAALMRQLLGLPQTGTGGHEDALLGDLFGLSANPYPWVVYHRLRIVLLDVLYMILDVLGDVLLFLASMNSDLFGLKSIDGFGTTGMRTLMFREPGGGDLMANASALTEPAEVQEILKLGTVAVAPDANTAGLWTRYRAVEKQALKAGADPVVAADLATDAVMEVSPAGNVLRVFGVVAPGTRDALVTALESEASNGPGVRERDTLAMRAYHPDDTVKPFSTSAEREVFVAADAAFRGTPLTELDKLAGRPGTVGEVLDRTETDIVKTHPDKTRFVSNTLVEHGRTVREASVALARAGWTADAKLRERVASVVREARSAEDIRKELGDIETGEAVAALSESLGLDATRRFVDRW